IRAMPIENGTDLATVFQTVSYRVDMRDKHIEVHLSETSLHVPESEEDLAYLSLATLSTLVRNKKISSLELTQMYLWRLMKHGDKLLAVVALMEDQAIAAAKKCDDDIASGKHFGPLHGIPTRVKDLFAMKGAPTTWGAEPFKDQVFDYDSAVVEKLKA